MKGLPLILTFIILGSKSPLYANRFPRIEPPVPEEIAEPAEPVTTVEDAAAWDALFSMEALSNVTCLTHVEVPEDGYAADRVSSRDGLFLESRYGMEADDLWSLDRYFPESELLLTCYLTSDFRPENHVFHTRFRAENWKDFGTFSLYTYQGRFEDMTYDEEDGCYVLTTGVSEDRIYVENGRLVRLDTWETILDITMLSSSVFTDYGTTVVTPLPELTFTVDAAGWQNAFTAEGLNNLTAFVQADSAAPFEEYVTIVKDNAYLEYYGYPTSKNPEENRLSYAYRNTDEGMFVESLLGEEAGDRQPLDSALSWDEHLLHLLGLNGCEKQFENAVYDPETGSYSFTMPVLDTENRYRLFFTEGRLSYVLVESDEYTLSYSFSQSVEGYLLSDNSSEADSEG